MRNVFDGKYAEIKYVPTLHDWAHAFKYSKTVAQTRAQEVVDLEFSERWFYRPNLTALKNRPFVFEHS